ncbi:unnamed protein product [Heligmosomoides polygyrus]|uniref:Uncharacterized protein n=1 Tax=Heligmosomoides polygyrus TaxID=6339 RepID=A0A183FBF8_HELPZ|nr:unnamed protein product [Heligmosomoides polygyrus]
MGRQNLNANARQGAQRIGCQLEDLLDGRHPGPNAIIPQLPSRITNRTGTEGSKNVNDICDVQVDNQAADLTTRTETSTTVEKYAFIQPFIYLCTKR